MDFEEERETMIQMVAFLAELEQLLLELHNALEPQPDDENDQANAINVDGNQIGDRNNERRARRRRGQRRQLVQLNRRARRGRRHAMVARPTNGFLRVNSLNPARRFTYRRLWQVGFAWV